MVSFFEKLKKGMGVEEEIKEPEKEIGEIKEEIPVKKERKVLKSSVKKAQVQKPKVLELKESEESGKKMEKPLEKIELEIETEKEPVKPTLETDKEVPPPPEENREKENWPAFDEESVGKLAIDVYQTEEELVIQSAIAGVKPENLDITLEKDLIMIRGVREKPFKDKGDYFSQECFWGPFSREIIMPEEIDPTRAQALMKDGILTIKIPKMQRERMRKIIIKG